MKNYEAEKLKKIIKAKEEAMVVQVAETDALRKELTKLKSSLLYSQKDAYDLLWGFRRDVLPFGQVSDHVLSNWFDENRIK